MFIAPALVLAGLAVLDTPCDDVTLTLIQPDFAPGELLGVEISAPAGSLGWLLSDPVPGPVEIRPDLVLAVGLSPQLTLAPFQVNDVGLAGFTSIQSCGRVVFDQDIILQAVLFDPITGAFCASEPTDLVGNDYGFCEPNCIECDGGLLDWTLRYTGAAAALVEVKKKGAGTVFVDAFLEPGTPFVVQNGGSLLPTNLEFFVDGEKVAAPKTNCSDPVGPGLEFGPFRVLEAIDSVNGSICPEGPTDCSAGKVGGLVMRFTGGDCSASANGQDPSAVSCSGDPSGLDEVRVVVSQNGSASKVFFDGIVEPGDTISALATDLGDWRLRSNMHVDVYDLDGNLVHAVSFHVSCSEPLAVGDVYGAVEVLELVAAY